MPSIIWYILISEKVKCGGKMQHSISAITDNLCLFFVYSSGAPVKPIYLSIFLPYFPSFHCCYIKTWVLTFDYILVLAFLVDSFANKQCPSFYSLQLLVEIFVCLLSPGVLQAVFCTYILWEDTEPLISDWRHSVEWKTYCMTCNYIQYTINTQNRS